jgi:hypothetical protein
VLTACWEQPQRKQKGTCEKWREGRIFTLFLFFFSLFFSFFLYTRRLWPDPVYMTTVCFPLEAIACSGLGEGIGCTAAPGECKLGL